MDKIFSSLKNLIKLDTVNIDNNVFRLHYKATVLVLVAFSILVTSRQYIGDPIDCISRDDIPSNLLDTFCWIHSTFSLEDAWDKKVGDEVPYPGVDKYTKGEKRVYHAYYQWVCFVLFLQAIMFYFPRYLWKLWEGGKMRNLVLDLSSPIMASERRAQNRDLLTDYLLINKGNHNLYAYSFFLCEVLNFVNVIGQMYLMNRFLNNAFTHYGSQVLAFTEWDWDVRYDPMIRVFPRLTKCTFHRYGPSGDVQKHDAMCILPINIINEKIYVFLWFWFIILAVLSGLVLVYRAAIFFWPRTRFLVLKSRARLCNPDYIEVILERCKLGDWFLLDLLCKNLDGLNFRDVVNDFAKKLEVKMSADLS